MTELMEQCQKEIRSKVEQLKAKEKKEEHQRQEDLKNQTTLTSTKVVNGSNSTLKSIS